MTLNEKINLLESRLGPYESWTEEHLIAVMSNEDLKAAFDAELTKELSMRNNPELFSFMDTMFYNYSLIDSNQRFLELLKKLESNPKEVQDELEKIVKDKSGNIFDKINAELVLLSRDEHLDDKPEACIVEEELIEDMNGIQELVVNLDLNYSMPTLQNLIMILYRIQEYYFEITGKDILKESEEFAAKKEEIQNLTISQITEMMGEIEKMKGMDGDDEEGE